MMQAISWNSLGHSRAPSSREKNLKKKKFELSQWKHKPISHKKPMQRLWTKRRRLVSAHSSIESLLRRRRLHHDGELKKRGLVGEGDTTDQSSHFSRLAVWLDPLPCSDDYHPHNRAAITGVNTVRMLTIPLESLPRKEGGDIGLTRRWWM